mgnify:CR=1 FL=1
MEWFEYQPHPRQMAAHEAPEPEVWVAGGYAVGKTTIGVHEAFNLAVITHPGFAGIVAAPTYPLLMQSWFQEWKRWIPQEWYVLKRDPLSGPYIALSTPSGESRIWLRSTSEPRSLEGINAGWLVFDEATRERSNDPIRVLRGRIRRGYPGRQRRVVLIGPPQTRTHWTAVDFGTGPGNGRRGDAMSWTDGTRRVVRARTRDNPHLPRDFERRMRTAAGATKAWCKQWLDAQFGAVEGQIFEAFDRDIHVVPARSLEGRTWRDTIGTIDWGYTHPGVFLTMAFDGYSIFILHEEVHTGKPVSDTPNGWVPIMRRETQRAKIKRIVGDPSQPGHLETVGHALRHPADRTLPRLTVNVYPADNTVQDGIRKVQTALEWAFERAQRLGAVTLKTVALYVSDACPFTIGQFESYVRRRRRDGSFSEDPEKTNDDTMDACRYGVMELIRD